MADLSKIINNKDAHAQYMADEIKHVCTTMPKRDPGSEGERMACEYFADVLKNQCGCERSEVEHYKENPGSFMGWIYITVTCALLGMISFFFIPVLGVDTHVHEPWTFEISSDFAGIGERFFLKDYVLLCHERNSKRLREEIREANPNVHFVSSFAQLDMLEEALQGKKVIVEGESMYDYLKNKNANFIKYVVDCEKKINKIVTCLKLAIEHAEVENHVFKMS